MDLYARGPARRSRKTLEARGTPAARDVPRLAPLSERRVALLHVHGARRSEGAELEQWRAAKSAATRRDRSARGGRSPTTTRSDATTRPGCRGRSASSASTCSASAKQRLDPAGVMNPGKLLPAEARRADVNEASCRGASCRSSRLSTGRSASRSSSATTTSVRGRMPVDGPGPPALRDRPRRRHVGARRVAHLDGDRARACIADGQDRDGPGDQRELHAADQRGPRERDRTRPAPRAGPPGTGRSRSPTTTAACAPCSAPRSRCGTRRRAVRQRASAAETLLTLFVGTSGWAYTEWRGELLSGRACRSAVPRALRPRASAPAR